MIAVDTNILVHAFVATSPLHSQAKAAVASLTTSASAWAIPWPCIHEFYGVATNQKLLKAPGIGESALAQITEWMRSPSLELLSESPNHWRTLERLLRTSGVTGPRVHDAKIAAICLDRGVGELLTLDRDFERFAGLSVRRLT